MKVFVPIIAVSALLASTVTGWSETVTGSLQVKITIAKECKITSSNTTLTFDGNKASVAGNIDNETAEKGGIEVQCTKDTPYTIALSSGQNFDNAAASRRMKSTEGKFVAYALYSDAKREQSWGATDSDVVGKKSSEVTGNGGKQSYPVYGRVIVPTGGLAAGNYADTVTVTLGF